ncbi:hypothetical protein PLICRDRAFT_181092 [Plicaturopsis crispa FD-325 SS-3]|uniref:Unplaced genomic scaffold PLICRscaffold_150, whole genome shotgun sequence n=1 Tax=Plicaturopsis crispa FD-325 SS-3 TaxID=944288 RepID=A0A0C9SJX4_PLICR|nr:hypothetical protein PLICRDRAFT_181092 [Plicaturopsis crispa FD-325 SS-3]
MKCADGVESVGGQRAHGPSEFGTNRRGVDGSFSSCSSSATSPASTHSTTPTHPSQLRGGCLSGIYYPFHLTHPLTTPTPALANTHRRTCPHPPRSPVLAHTHRARQRARPAPNALAPHLTRSPAPNALAHVPSPSPLPRQPPKHHDARRQRCARWTAGNNEQNARRSTLSTSPLAIPITREDEGGTGGQRPARGWAANDAGGGQRTTRGTGTNDAGDGSGQDSRERRALSPSFDAVLAGPVGGRHTAGRAPAESGGDHAPPLDASTLVPALQVQHSKAAEARDMTRPPPTRVRCSTTARAVPPSARAVPPHALSAPPVTLAVPAPALAVPPPARAVPPALAVPLSEHGILPSPRAVPVCWPIYLFTFF